MWLCRADVPYVEKCGSEGILSPKQLSLYGTCMNHLLFWFLESKLYVVL